MGGNVSTLPPVRKVKGGKPLRVTLGGKARVILHYDFFPQGLAPTVAATVRLVQVQP